MTPALERFPPPHSFNEGRQERTLKVRVERQIGAGVFSMETGELAKQAAGSCLVQYGETVVLCAAASGPGRVGIDFFPLTCDYRERVAAAGKFPGGFLNARAAHHQGDPHRPLDGSTHPPLLSRVVPR